VGTSSLAASLWGCRSTALHFATQSSTPWSWGLPRLLPLQGSECYVGVLLLLALWVVSDTLLFSLEPCPHIRDSPL